MPFFVINIQATGPSANMVKEFNMISSTTIEERHVEEAPDFDTALRRVEDYYPTTEWERFTTGETEEFIDGEWIAHHSMDLEEWNKR